MQIIEYSPNDLFGNKYRSIEVPFFQRTYVWSEYEWDRFLDSMIETSELDHGSDQKYFMGCLILKQENRSAKETISDIALLIDGQQRLTTFLIFMRVLDEEFGAQETYKDNFFNAKDEPILHHNYNDINCFNAIVNGRAEEVRSKYIKKTKYQNDILKAYDYFKKDERIKEFSEDSRLTINLKLNFIGLRVGKEEDEQKIFDTINSIGVSLTAAELLKNELFSFDDRNLYEATWKEEFEKNGANKKFWDKELARKRLNIDLFMQSSLLIFSQDAKDSKSKDEKAKDEKAKDEYENIGKLFGNYKKYLKEEEKIGKGDRKFVEKLCDLAECYRENINFRLLGGKIDKRKPLQRLMPLIFGSQTTTAVPYILYVLNQAEQSKQDDIFSFLESYLARRIICKESTKNYNKLFAQMIHEGVKSKGELMEFFSKSDTSNFFPNDKQLQEGFESSPLANRDAKTILYLLDTSLGDEAKAAIELKSYNKFSIEHIMPKAWVGYWKGENIDEEERNRLVLTMGNLTIAPLELNSSMGNDPWNRKQEKLKKYAKGLKTLDRKEFLNKIKWDEKTIKKRAQWLYKHSLKIWPYPGMKS